MTINPSDGGSGHSALTVSLLLRVSGEIKRREVELDPLYPSLISLMFSVDVKHHVYFIFAGPSAQKRS